MVSCNFYQAEKKDKDEILDLLQKFKDDLIDLNYPDIDKDKVRNFLNVILKRGKIICIKNLDQTEAWFAYDTKRMVSNHTRYTLKPSEPDVEQSGTAHELLDILSNGFKLRYNTAGTNDVNTHIFFAFAESPFVNSKGVPCNAR